MCLSLKMDARAQPVIPAKAGIPVFLVEAPASE